MPKRYAEIAVKVYWFYRNSRHMVAVDCKHDLSVLLVSGVCKFDLDYVSEVMG